MGEGMEQAWQGCGEDEEERERGEGRERRVATKRVDGIREIQGRGRVDNKESSLPSPSSTPRARGWLAKVKPARCRSIALMLMLFLIKTCCCFVPTMPGRGVLSGRPQKLCAKGGLRLLHCFLSPPPAPAALHALKMSADEGIEWGAERGRDDGDGNGGSMLKEPASELVEAALNNAEAVIRAAGGCIDSLSFGREWKSMFPDFPRSMFDGTRISSFNKLLSVYGADRFVIEETKKKEIKLYVLKDAKGREGREAYMRAEEQLAEVHGLPPPCLA
eukprot:272925-Hanusia_phi.AAC.2